MSLSSSSSDSFHSITCFTYALHFDSLELPPSHQNSLITSYHLWPVWFEPLNASASAKSYSWWWVLKLVCLIAKWRVHKVNFLWECIAKFHLHTCQSLDTMAKLVFPLAIVVLSCDSAYCTNHGGIVAKCSQYNARDLLILEIFNSTWWTVL